MTNCQAGQVTVIVGVVGLGKEGHQGIALSRAVGLGLADTGIGPHIVGVQHEVVIFLAAEPDIILAVQLHTDESVGAVLADFQIVACHGVPHPFCPVLLLGLHAVDGVGHCAFGDGILEDALLLLCIVDAEGGAQVQILDGVYVDEGIAEHTPVDVAVVAVAVQACQGVLAVGVAAHGPGIFAAGGIDGQ